MLGCFIHQFYCPNIIRFLKVMSLTKFSKRSTLFLEIILHRYGQQYMTRVMQYESIQIFLRIRTLNKP